MFVGYPLKSQSINTRLHREQIRAKLDIHLKVKALTLFKPEHNESQLYITKIK